MIEKELAVGSSIEIIGDDAHHISHVLRLNVGDWIVLSDGKGSRFKCSITTLGKKAVSAKVIEKLPDLNLTNITLAQAVTKHDKFEFIIQKAIELGVTKIIPFTSERTIPKFSDNASETKIERWNKIATEAAKQCGLPIKPIVEPITKINELINSPETYENKMFFYEGEEETTPKKYFNSAKPQELKNLRTIIIIGPEGGFTSKEVEAAKESGFTTLKLGPLIMRAETAAISAVTLTQYFLKYFD